MKMLKFLTACTLFFGLLSLLEPSPAFAGPKSHVCKPDICLFPKSLPSRARKGIPKSTGFISTPKRAELGAPFIELPRDGNEPETNSIKVKANRLVTTRCLYSNGRVDCYNIVDFDKCPGTILVQSTDLTWYECNIQCDPPTPDSEGECDCDIQYDTCH